MNKEFWKALGIRCIRTFLTTILGVWTAGTLITDIDWSTTLLAAVSATVYIVLLSIVSGLPEVPIEDTLQTEFNEDDIEEMFEVEADDYENEIDAAEE